MANLLAVTIRVPISDMSFWLYFYATNNIWTVASELQSGSPVIGRCPADASPASPSMSITRRPKNPGLVRIVWSEKCVSVAWLFPPGLLLRTLRDQPPPKASCCCLISTEKNGTIHKTSSIVVAGFSKNPSVSVYHHFRKLLCLATQGHMKLSLNNPIYNSLILQLETSVRNKNKTHFWANTAMFNVRMRDGIAIQLFVMCPRMTRKYWACCPIILIWTHMPKWE